MVLAGLGMEYLGLLKMVRLLAILGFQVTLDQASLATQAGVVQMYRASQVSQEHLHLASQDT
jgi:hypothetical protein